MTIGTLAARAAAELERTGACSRPTAARLGCGTGIRKMTRARVRDVLDRRLISDERVVRLIELWLSREEGAHRGA